MADLGGVTSLVGGAMGCDVSWLLWDVASDDTRYGVCMALAVCIVLLNWVWQLFKNFGLGAGIEA